MRHKHGTDFPQRNAGKIQLPEDPVAAAGVHKKPGALPAEGEAGVIAPNGLRVAGAEKNKFQNNPPVYYN